MLRRECITILLPQEMEQQIKHMKEELPSVEELMLKRREEREKKTELNRQERNRKNCLIEEQLEDQVEVGLHSTM